jgi:hypothetical protein
MVTPAFLLWCAAINYGVLLLAFGGFVLAHDAMYRLHHRWFDLSPTRFDELVYGMLGIYKLAIWFFLLVPGLVLLWIR